MNRPALPSRHGFTIGSESHRNVVKELKEVLRVFHQFAVDTKLRYWAEYGTLIGVYRHRDIVPWDDDIDLAVWEQDWDQILDLWAAAGATQTYKTVEGTAWDHWKYKTVNLNRVPVMLIRQEHNDRWFKLRLESHVTYTCDISGIDLYCRDLIIGIDPGQINEIIQPHPFGEGRIMAPKREYSEQHLCNRYGSNWHDWRCYLEETYGFPRNTNFKDITLDNFDQYCRQV